MKRFNSDATPGLIESTGDLDDGCMAICASPEAGRPEQADRVNKGLLPTKTSLRSACAAETCYVGPTT